VFFCAAVFLAAPTFARATNLVITPTFDSSITSDPNAAAIEGAINSAIGFYESHFTDPINVKITFQETSSGLGGSQWSYFSDVSYQAFVTALQNDKTTADDTTALAHLPTGSTNPVTGSTTINVKSATVRALGMTGFISPSSDGTISINTHITDTGSPGTTGQYSLTFVTEHEIDEILGLGSALPNLTDPLPEDLFRYDANGNRSFTNSSSATSFFSLDGMHDLAQFDNQNDGGDFGDWQSNPLPSGVLPEIQDAFATQGAHPSLGVELRALDVIGYNYVPEPGSVTLLGLGAIGFLFVKRRPLLAAVSRRAR
jgi:hypothetical protein